MDPVSIAKDNKAENFVKAQQSKESRRRSVRQDEHYIFKIENLPSVGHAGLYTSKQQRLHKKREIDALFAVGNHGYAHPFKYRFTLHETCEPTAILVSIPKKLHKRAVRRNLLKRRTRESYRQCKDVLNNALAEKGLAAHIAFIYGSNGDFRLQNHRPCGAQDSGIDSGSQLSVRHPRRCLC